MLQFLLPSGERNLPTAKQIQERVLALDKAFMKAKPKEDDGSTAVFVFVSKGDDASQDAKSAHESALFNVTVGNVGDSRALLIRGDGSVEALTSDHKPTVAAEKARIKAASGHLENNYQRHGDWRLAVSRAIGDRPFKSNAKRSAVQQKVIALPDVTGAVARAGDIVLLACDGLFEKLSNEQVATGLRAALVNAQDGDLAVALCALMDASLSAGSRTT